MAYFFRSVLWRIIRWKLVSSLYDWSTKCDPYAYGCTHKYTHKRVCSLPSSYFLYIFTNICTYTYTHIYVYLYMSPIIYIFISMAKCFNALCMPWSLNGKSWFEWIFKVVSYCVCMRVSLYVCVCVHNSGGDIHLVKRCHLSFKRLPTRWHSVHTHTHDICTYICVGIYEKYWVRHLMKFIILE